jgi:dihydroxyacetone kinase-like protein
MAYDAARFRALFHAMADAMEREKDALCRLDGAIGDGDHGLAMAGGFAAVRAALDALPGDAAPADVFNTAAKAFLNAVGASSGPLYATAFLRAGAFLKGKAEASPEDVAALIPAIARGIADRGKAPRGAKTMLDAWGPAADAAEGRPLAEALAAAAGAAEAGAEATRALQAELGRAARLGPRSRGHIDPGAASAAILVRTMAAALAPGRDDNCSIPES